MENRIDLETSLLRFKQAQRIANFGDWELNYSTGLAIWSEEACRMYGLPTDSREHTYEEWESFIHPEDLDRVRNIITESGKTHTAHNFQYRIIRGDGSQRQIHLYAEYQFDRAKQPIGLYGVVHDITDSIKTKRDLSQTEESLKLILDLIPLSIYARQENGDYIFGNHVFLDHYGITEEELRGKNIKDFVRTQGELDELSSQDRLVLTSRKKLIVSEFKQTDHQGLMKTWRIIKIPFTPNGQDEKAILGIAEDITTAKEREEAIINMSKSISARNKDLEKFSMMVSHDLRGPVSSIMGVAGLIDDVELNQDELSVFISGIKTALTKLDEIIRVMNDLTGKEDYVNGKLDC